MNLLFVTDGNSVSRRVFKIFVVGDDFRADNTVLQVSNGVFTADNSNLRTYLDYLQIQVLNVQTIILQYPLDVIDTNVMIGFINYNLETTNFGIQIINWRNNHNGQYEISGILSNFIDSGRGSNLLLD